MSLEILVGGHLGLLLIVFSAVSANGCVYNGVTYQDGDIISDICIDITCLGGQWVTTGTFNGNCGLCSLSDDPHIWTFDYPTAMYDWHGTCNYSISQLDFSYFEKFGIYGQFQQCGSASCVHHTTFTDNPNTVVEIDHSNLGNVWINGNSHSVLSVIVGAPSPNQPVLFWESQFDSCSMFLGSQGLLLKTCPNQIYVWAHPNLVNRLNGLCGHFNFDQSDEFTDRSGAVHPWVPNPFVFPVSWLTAEQSANCCLKDGGEDPCKDDELRMKMFEVCLEFLKDVQWEDNAPSDEALKKAILNCATDLCNLAVHRTRREEIEEWKKKMQTMLRNNIIIEAMTRNCENDKECREPVPMDKKDQHK